jgi:hypothetical protein
MKSMETSAAKKTAQAAARPHGAAGLWKSQGVAAHRVFCLAAQS